MADNFNKDTQERIKLLEQERSLQFKLTELLQTKVTASGKLTKIHENLVKNISKSTDLEGALLSIQRAKDDVIRKYKGANKDLQKVLLQQLEDAEKFLEVEQNRKAATEKLIDAEKEFRDTQRGILNDLLGISSELEQSVMNGTFKALLLKTAFDNVKDNVSGIVSGLKDGVTQMGLSVGQSAQLQGNIASAKFSMTGLLYGQEALAQSANAIVDTYGSAAAATESMIKSVTELSAITGDTASAAELAKIFEQAGVEADNVKGIISDIAQKEGISAKKAMEGMTDQMTLLVGKSETQLKTIIATNAQLVKQGTNLSQIQEISNSMLDIESSLKAEAKARAFLGRDINASAVREASLRLQTARTEEERKQAAIDISNAILDGVGGMDKFAELTLKEKELLADSYGLTADSMATMLEQNKVQQDLNDKYGEYADTVGSVKDALKISTGFLADTGIELAKVVAQATVLNLLQGRPALGGLFGGKSKVAAIKPNVNKTPDVTGGDSGGMMKGVTDTTSNLDANKLLAGGAAILILSAALFVAAKAFQEFGSVTWPAVAMGLVGLAGMAAIAYVLGEAQGEMIKGAIAVAILGAALIPFAFSMSLIAGLDMDSVIAAAAGLVIFSAAVFGLGALMYTGAGAALFGAGLAALAGLGLAMMVLGAGLLVAGAGFEKIGGSMGSIISTISQVGSVIGGMFQYIVPIAALALALVGLAGALTLVGIAGMASLPGLLAIAAVGTIAVGVGSLLGFGGDKTEGGEAGASGGNSALLEEIKGLRSDIQSQPIVISVDGKVVQQISKVQSRQKSFRGIYNE